MNDIASRIAKAMEQQNISYGELARITGIPKSAVFRYVTGQTGKMPLPRLELIAKALHVEPAYLMGWEEEAAPPSPPLLSNLRDIDPIYDALNKDGQKELCRYGRYLTTLDEYRHEESAPQIEYIRHYLTAAAAGYAAPIEGEDYELIPRGPSVPASADFCIDITGDSMEPYIKNGSTVYIQRGADLAPFEPGVFFVDGDVYCKQYCPSYDGSLMLLSANPKREDANLIIPRDSGRNVQYFGKVLLKTKLPQPEYF